MLFLLISCFSFIFFFKNPLLPIPIKSEWRLLVVAPFFWKELSNFFASWFQKSKLFPMKMPSKKKKMMNNLVASKVVEVEEEEEEEAERINSRLSLLDLPELTLECILGRLSPSGLCSMAGVCRSLRERCTSDHLWEKHLKQKWGRLIGDAAYKEWQWRMASRKRPNLLEYQSNQMGLLLRSLSFISSFWPFSLIKPKTETRSKPMTCLPVDSIMALYLSLENGKFCFPAQVYNRENGHVGFMLSCYDAQLSYDSQTDTFQARYSPFGRRMVEDGIHWDRLRAPPVDTPANVLHISECLNDLRPGDHIEIQWRRSIEFPYGWWYAVVGHLETCDGNENLCRCQYSDIVILEFNQYTFGSRWRQTTINRKDHKEEGNEADGFYGGIRKLYKEEEISMWKRLWPKHVFEQ